MIKRRHSWEVLGFEGRPLWVRSVPLKEMWDPSVAALQSTYLSLHKSQNSISNTTKKERRKKWARNEWKTSWLNFLLYGILCQQLDKIKKKIFSHLILNSGDYWQSLTIYGLQLPWTTLISSCLLWLCDFFRTSVILCLFPSPTKNNLNCHILKNYISSKVTFMSILAYDFIITY